MITTTTTTTHHHRPLAQRALVVATGALLGIGATSCADDPAESQPTVTVSAATTTVQQSGDVTTDATDASPVAVGALTDDEIAGLLWMREEEQLAHDVYVALGELWGLRIFDNISASESTHIASVIDLLDRYGIADPAEGNPPGTFTDPQIQALYDQLIADGSASLTAALAAGALIEELDISDLQLRATDVDDIAAVYANLELGSRNHLRAFTSQLADRDVPYEPTVLGQDAYDAIVTTAMERGQGG